MRLCANENIPEDCVLRLRQEGHDVLWIREAAPGSPDEAVLALAAADDRLLITYDKDFGELRFPARCERIARDQFVSHSTAFRIRLGGTRPAVLASRDDWPGHFSVVEEFAIRMRRLPER